MSRTFILKSILCLFILGTGTLSAQLAFCEGDLGDPIFTEDFGSGTTNGPPLEAGTTTYTYVNNAPQDGFYTISSVMQQLGSFHPGPDRTPNDQNGKAFIVNASFTADEFYRRTIQNLCENTSYEFSAYVQNLYDRDNNACSNGGIPVNVRFQIWDSTDTQLLASGDTGNIEGTSNPVWTQYGLVFQTQAGQNEVILKMINNGDGGCGNDLAIDDIVFRACGDITQITSDIAGADDLSLCNSQTSLSTVLTVSAESGAFIQWQSSANGENWSDINGATSNTYTVSGLTITAFYRVNTATDVDNLGNVFCSFFSDPYLIDFIEGPSPPQSNGDVIFCDNENAPALSVVPVQGVEMRWFTSPTSTEVIATGGNFSPDDLGTYYVQAFIAGTDCGSLSRTPLTINSSVAPVFENPIETLEICDNQEVKTLSVGLTAVSYLWSTGETTSSISISTGGTYTVTVTNAAGCSATKTFQVNGLDIPVISSINSDGEDIIVQTASEGDYEYSLNGFSYSSAPIFRNQPGGLVTVYVRNVNGCLPVTQQFYHFNIPTYFTPNNDGINDFFFLPDATFFESSFIQVFDRFGKIITSGDGQNFQWDGTYNGKRLLPNDYWYLIKVDDRVVTGHISLLF